MLRGYRLAVLLSLSLWAAAALTIHLLHTRPTFTLTMLACGLALGMYAFKYRHQL